jgi:uncharacterized protein with GYD domain
MPTYIGLLNYTQDGITNIKDSPTRLDEARALAESMGGEFDWYLTFGQYDAVVVADFPDDETWAQFALAAMSQGALSGETLKAFDEAEYRDVIEGIPG